MGRLAVRFLFALGLVVATAYAVYAWGVARITAPGPLDHEVTLILPKGIGVSEIGRRLGDAGIIESPVLFMVAARLSGADRRLKAGEYRFEPSASPRAVMALLLGGRTVARTITVAEGLTTVQVLALVAAAEGFEGDVPDDVPEGSLLPETYHYSYGDSRRALVVRMRQVMDRTLTELWSTRAPNLPLGSPQEALILASIVEKETGIAEERARIAGVFVNRLHRGMRLQSDPTVAYGLTGGKQPLPRALTRADLAQPTPFNTYIVRGLPPRPIANPGRASIAAVMRPLATQDLYFVADGSGGHAFASTLKGHTRNVARWRRQRRQTR